VKEAASKTGLLISHTCFLYPLKSLLEKASMKKIIIKALKENIAIYSYIHVSCFHGKCKMKRGRSSRLRIYSTQSAENTL
jgi:hypothetical protein